MSKGLRAVGDGSLLQWRRCRNAVYPLSHIWVYVQSPSGFLNEDARSYLTWTGMECLHRQQRQQQETREIPTVQGCAGTQAPVISAANPYSRLFQLIICYQHAKQSFPMIGEEGFEVRQPRTFRHWSLGQSLKGYADRLFGALTWSSNNM
jgi:hypothetical protein